MEHIKEIKLAAVGVIGALTGLWGWMGWLIWGWIGCMCLDYITGSAAAMKSGEWASNKAREGVWHKAGMVVVVLVAIAADLLISMVLEHLPVLALPVEYSGLICPVVLVWYIVTELGSILENAVKMGAAVPSWLTKILKIGKKAIDETGEKLEEQSTDPAEEIE